MPTRQRAFRQNSLASKSKKTSKAAGSQAKRRPAPEGKAGKRATASSSAAGARAKRPAKPAAKAKDRTPRRSKASFGPASRGRVQTLGPAGAGGDAALDAKRRRQTADSLETAKSAIDAALDKKALLPVLIDVSSLASYTDFIGIVSGRSDRQVDAIADGILAAMKGRGRSLLGQEGTGSGRWTLLDFGDVVFHVFYHPVREFYDLESLWIDAPRVQLRIPPEAVMAQPDALYGNL